MKLCVLCVLLVACFLLFSPAICGAEDYGVIAARVVGKVIQNGDFYLVSLDPKEQFCGGYCADLLTHILAEFERKKNLSITIAIPQWRWEGGELYAVVIKAVAKDTKK